MDNVSVRKGTFTQHLMVASYYSVCVVLCPFDRLNLCLILFLLVPVAAHFNLFQKKPKTCCIVRSVGKKKELYPVQKNNTINTLASCLRIQIYYSPTLANPTTTTFPPLQYIVSSPDGSLLGHHRHRPRCSKPSSLLSTAQHWPLEFEPKNGPWPTLQTIRTIYIRRSPLNCSLAWHVNNNDMRPGTIVDACTNVPFQCAFVPAKPNDQKKNNTEESCVVSRKTRHCPRKTFLLSPPLTKSNDIEGIIA